MIFCNTKAAYGKPSLMKCISTAPIKTMKGRIVPNPSPTVLLFLLHCEL